MIRVDYLRRAEWTLALLLSATALFLLTVRITHAGALWRDEVAVANLAQMPAIADVARNFQHEAFPVPFPLLVRAYTKLFGASDFALRCFGFIAGIAVCAALWLVSRIIGRGPPLLALALLGLNSTFLFWGTTLRGYGLGSALIALVFGCFVSVLNNPSLGRIILTSALSIAATQVLVHNLALIAALAFAGAMVSLFRHDLKALIVFSGIFAVCLVSFLPYLGAYSSSWSQIVEFPVTLRFLWNQFNFALGNPNRAFATFWHVGFIFFFSISVWTLFYGRSENQTPDRQILWFGLLSILAAPVAYGAFLETLSYLARSWYFLALLTVIAVGLDCLAAVLSRAMWIRVIRLAFAAIALVVLPINAWPKIHERQTNIDIVADKIALEARSSDLIVFAPWQYAISFNRYYRGPAPSITLPSIVDLRVHRYDLFREKMSSEHPIDDVLAKIQQTLASGNRVWIVGGIKLPPEGRAPRSLPPAPNANVGWDNVAYSDAWLEQMSVFVREHSARGETVSLGLTSPVNPFEDVTLMVIADWQ